MTIRSVRIYCYSTSRLRTRQLNNNHWGFAEWFERRLKPIRAQLRGPEATGVNIVNLLLYEDPEHARRPDQWSRCLNAFEFSFVCDLRPLGNASPIENIEKLMPFFSVVAAQAPWPQVRAVAGPLAEPLSVEDRATLLPFLRWPREVGYTAQLVSGSGAA